MKGYSTQEVAELLALSPRLIRRIAHGVMDPDRVVNGRYHFSFQDIVLLRTAKEMLGSGVPASRITRTLFRLQQQLPKNRPLTSLRISSDGGAVVIRENNHIYNPDSGQLHFDFAIAELAGNVAPLARQAAEDAANTPDMSSDDWFDLAVDLEAVSPEDAPAAYLESLALDPEHADAHINLGRLRQRDGLLDDAQTHYQAALALDPENALAAYNLGTLLEDMGQLQEAITAYQSAQSFPDAHYNLSRLYELVGSHDKALDHLRIYRRLIDPIKH